MQLIVMIKEVIGKPTVGVETKLLLVPELIEAHEGKVVEAVSYTHLDVYKRQVLH